MARVYVDQLERSESLSKSFAGSLTEQLDRTALLLEEGSLDTDLATRLESMAATLGEGDGDAITKRRRAGLVETLRGIAARLR